MTEPKPTITFITGGARSGKSAYAVELAKRSTGTAAYLATAEPIDDEMRERIATHKEERPAAWQTIEEPVELAQQLRDQVQPGTTVILDCLTVWLGNVMQRDAHASTLRSRVQDEVSQLQVITAEMQLDLIAISNEVGSGIVPADPSTRLYRDLLGEINQRMAAIATSVVLMVSGVPLAIRSPGEGATHEPE